MNKGITMHASCGLTEREYEVLCCLARGLTNIETAKELFLSTETIKSHRSRLMQKLDARNALHLGVLAVTYGIVSKKLQVA